jgi:hypothetical protein
MKIVHGDESPLVAVPTTRSGTLNRQNLLAGETNTPGNFVCGIYYQTGDFASPRHHHNFDQWRLQLEGTCSFARNGTMKPGTLGYFPEAAYYGPQTSDEPNATVVVQFGGPSGNGYLGGAQFAAAVDALKAHGRFEDGVFHRNPGLPGKSTVDGFQAAWEHANGRPMVYPTPQYNDPILLETGAYRWSPLDGAPGVEVKSYGTFTDCAIRAASYKLDPGATLRACGRGIFLVLAGGGTLARGPYRRFTALYLDAGERAAFAARELTEIVLLGLPDVAHMKRALPEPATAAPA